MLVLKNGFSSDNLVQVYWTFTADVMWVRHKDLGNWKSWKEIAKKDEVVNDVQVNDVSVLEDGVANIDLTGKQDITDNNLTTLNKNITPAINEVNSIAKGANQAVSYDDYETMITELNDLDGDKYKAGQNVMIVTLNVPDLWIKEVSETSEIYTYVDDETVISDLETNGYIQCGYYQLSMLETQKVDLTDYVKNTDYATSSKPGLIRVDAAFGTAMTAWLLKAAVRTYAQYTASTGDIFIGKGTLENVIAGKGLVSKTDYASSSDAGVIKVDSGYGTMIGNGILKAIAKTYAQYQSMDNSGFVGKATLENVIAGKQLTDKTYVDGLVGDVESLMANLYNGGGAE